MMARWVRPDGSIGRAAVLAAAAPLLRDSLAGAGQFLLVSGEAGIGKTAVLEALVAEAGPAALVLRGICWEGDGAPPYWPWSQVLRATGLPAAELGEAGWLLGSDGAPRSRRARSPPPTHSSGCSRRCRGACRASRPDGRCWSSLDDLQWADDPSLRLLGFLARTLATSRVLLLGAYRDQEASQELLALAGRARQLPLTGLDESDVEAMLAALAGPGVATAVSERMWQRSGGNPFFVRELTRLLVAQGWPPEQTPIPANIAETLRRRLARLSTACVRLLDWAAVAGRDIDLALLSSSGAADSRGRRCPVLDEARRAGVVDISSAGPRFTHDLYRETILDGLNPTTREDINLAVGRALQARSATAARIASHLIAAGARAEHDAIDYSLLAAREATARLGHDDACRHYLRALHLLDANADTGRADDRVALCSSWPTPSNDPGRLPTPVSGTEKPPGAARARGDAVTLARAALGLHALGHRSGGESTEVLDLLHAAARLLREQDGPLTLQSQVTAALAREMRHGTIHAPDADVVDMAVRAVDLADRRRRRPCAGGGETRPAGLDVAPGHGSRPAAGHRRDARRSLRERRCRPGRGSPPAPCCRTDRARRPHRASRAGHLHLPGRRAGARAGTMGRAHPAGHPRPADRSRRRGGAARPSRRSSSDRRSANPTPWPASAPAAGRWSPSVSPSRSWSWSPSTHSGRCFPSSRPGRTPPAATLRGQPRRWATSACSTSPKPPAPKDSPPPRSSSPSPAPPRNDPGPTNGYARWPAPT